MVQTALFSRGQENNHLQSSQARCSLLSAPLALSVLGCYYGNCRLGYKRGFQTGLRGDWDVDYRNLPGCLKCALKCGTLSFKSERSWVGVVFSAAWSELFPPQCSKESGGAAGAGGVDGTAPGWWIKEFFLPLFQLKCWLCGMSPVCSSALLLWGEVGCGLLKPKLMQRCHLFCSSAFKQLDYVWCIPIDQE